MWAYLNRPLSFHLPTRKTFVDKGEHLFHGAYLGAIAVDFHGWYSVFAGTALLFVVLSFFQHPEVA